MSDVLQQKLSSNSQPEAPEAGRIAASVRDAIEHTRTLARGLSPVEAESVDLMSSLGEIASSTSALFHVSCRFHAAQPVTINDAAISTHLYRITQEAISNAIRHGHASVIDIALDAAPPDILLSIRDNGAGFPSTSAEPSGMGLRIMKYRASVIGGILETAQAPGGGVVVSCRFRPSLSAFQ